MRFHAAPSSCFWKKRKKIKKGLNRVSNHTLAWWRHQMEKIFRATGHLCGEFTGLRWIPRTYKGQWRGALMFSLICTWINGWVNNGEAGDLRRYRAHYDVTVMVNLMTLRSDQERLKTNIQSSLNWSTIPHYVQDRVKSTDGPALKI